MPKETTALAPQEEARFAQWARESGIRDLDQPQTKYDYRGFFKKYGPVKYQWGKDHLPDEFKQHGHETFSQESHYSSGPSDGGMWLGETFIEQPPMARSHITQQDLSRAINALLMGK